MSNLVDKEIELQVMTCLDILLDRANHDEYLQRIGKKEALRFLEKNSQCVEIIKSRLQHLESIDNSNPSEALECFENIQYRIAANISTIEYATIKQALQRLNKYEQILCNGRLTDRNYKNTTLDLDSCKPYLRLGQLEDIYEEGK